MVSCNSTIPSKLGVPASWKPICHGYDESHETGDKNDNNVEIISIIVNKMRSTALFTYK